MDPRAYLALARRRALLVVLFTMLGGAAGVSIALLLPPTYVSEATLVVESEQIPDELAVSTVQVGASEQLQIIQQQILTRDILLEMANRLGIYSTAGGREDRAPSADLIVKDMRHRVGINTTGGQGQATIVKVSFEAANAQLASTVANELVTLILQENLEMRTRTAGQTLDFFDQEVERLNRSLTESGAVIQAFQEENRDALPDSLEFRRSRLVTEQERLLQIQRDDSVLRARRSRLMDLYEGTGQLLPDSSDGQQTDAERDLQDLRNQLTASLGVLSSSNPRIAMLRSQIAALELQVAGSTGSVPADGNQAQAPTAYDLELADLDGQIDILEEQRSQTEANVASLLASIEATPRNANRLDELQRDYDNTRAQFDEAVQRRALAQTGELIETLSRGQRISVIEQAVAPEQPEKPNRLLVAASGVGAGLFAGAFLSAILELLDRSIRTAAQLSAELNIVPFATIPIMRSSFDRRRRTLRLGIWLIVVLVLIPGALWLVDSQVMGLDLFLVWSMDWINEMARRAMGWFAGEPV